MRPHINRGVTYYATLWVIQRTKSLPLIYLKDIRKILKTLIVAVSFYSFLAWANVAQEDTIAVDIQSALYVTVLNVPPDSPPSPKFDLTPTEDGFCVSFVKKNGFSQYSGNANEWMKYINSRIPAIGEAVVLSYGDIGHLALITNITDEGIEIYEQNFVGQWIVSHQLLDKRRVIGYISN